MKTNIKYEPPMIEVIEVEVEGRLAVSGYGQDTGGNHDFGGRGANGRRGEWGDLWEYNWE